MKYKCLVLAAVGYVSAMAQTGGAGPQRPEDLAELSLEQLLRIEVTSVSKKEQKLSEVAAAVYVITQEDIRRSGLTTIAEILRLAPGLQVARADGDKWAISSRGFNSRFANKMLVLMDGRSVYSSMFSGVYWESQDTLVEDIERIEVIRGPGASMWGANAVNGVINIITKKAEQTQGLLSVAGAGNQERGFGSLRYGGTLGPGAYYRVYSKYFHRSFPADRLSPGRQRNWQMPSGGFRMDWAINKRDSLMLLGEIFNGSAEQAAEVPTLSPPYRARIDERNHAAGENWLARWERQVSEDARVDLQVYYDRYKRTEALLGQAFDTVDVEFQHLLEFKSRHEFQWGLGHRVISDAVQSSPQVRLNPSRYRENLSSVFLQDDWHLVTDRLHLTVGARLERNAYTGFEFQPTARLLWTPTRRHTGWAAVSRAVRTPSRAEMHASFLALVIPSGFGPPVAVMNLGRGDAQSEGLIAYEAGYRVQASSRVSLDLAAFYNRYRNLVGTRMSSFPEPDYRSQPFRLVLPVYRVNGHRAETRGLEVAASWDAHKHWRLRASYSRLDVKAHLGAGGVDVGAANLETINPKHHGQIHSFLDLPRNWSVNVAAYAATSISAFGITGLSNAPGYVRLDAHLSWRPKPQLEFSMGAQNLLGSRPAEFVHEHFFQPTQIRPAAYGKITWRY